MPAGRPHASPRRAAVFGVAAMLVLAVLAGDCEGDLIDVT
jgi:hypothetical protein